MAIDDAVFLGAFLLTTWSKRIMHVAGLCLVSYVVKQILEPHVSSSIHPTPLSC